MKIEIYMACPKCLSEGRDSSQNYWRHSWPCGGILMLDDKARVICQVCHNSGNLLQMKLQCDQGVHNYAIASLEGYAAALSTTSHFVNGGGLAWLQNVLRYLNY